MPQYVFSSQRTGHNLQESVFFFTLRITGFEFRLSCLVASILISPASLEGAVNYKTQFKGWRLKSFNRDERESQANIILYLWGSLTAIPLKMCFWNMYCHYKIFRILNIKTSFCIHKHFKIQYIFGFYILFKFRTFLDKFGIFQKYSFKKN